jgi:hypothetical protein
VVAGPDDAPLIAGAALARFAASGSDKAAGRAAFARHRIAEGVERRRGRRVDFRVDVRAGDRVDLVVENPPGGQPLDIVPIESDKPASVNCAGERSSQAQNAVGERSMPAR